MSAPASSTSVDQLAAGVAETTLSEKPATAAASPSPSTEGEGEELNPDGTKKLSKSQLKKQAKMAELAAKKAENAAKRESAAATADAEKIERAKAIKLEEDKNLPTAKRVRRT